MTSLAAACVVLTNCMLSGLPVLCPQIEQITQEQLEVVIADREKPIIVDFFATWCGPCVMLGKELEKVCAKPHPTMDAPPQPSSYCQLGYRIVHE